MSEQLILKDPQVGVATAIHYAEGIWHANYLLEEMIDHMDTYGPILIGRKVRKPGLYDRKIATAKANAVEATYKGHSEGKRAIMLGCYGAKPQTDMQRAVARRMDQPSACQGAMFFTERGDFTHLSGRGI